MCDSPFFLLTWWDSEYFGFHIRFLALAYPKLCQDALLV